MFVFVIVCVFYVVFGFVLEEEDAATCKRQELTPDRRKGNTERGTERGGTGGRHREGETQEHR